MYQLLNDPVTGAPAPNTIKFTGSDGIAWFVPKGHWMWDDYQAWLAAGNTPLAAA